LSWLILVIVSDQQAAAEIHLIEVGGLTVAYRQVGSGPTLVLLHGAFEDGRVSAHGQPRTTRGIQHSDPSLRWRGLTDPLRNSRPERAVAPNLHPPFRHVAYPA
jgi:pimeloyl-ACP methyl ester carboxylesterase